LSDGRRIPNPAPLQAALQELRLLNRQLARGTGPIAPDGTRQEPSNGWLEARRRLGRAHARVANIRRDALHHLTSGLAATYETVVVERLNVAGMLKNRRLARRRADAGFGELRRQLGYKTAWAGGTLVQADTFFPSSKTCSGCGHVRAKLPLSERTYRCERCGLVLDRDENAARNLDALLQAGAEMEVVAGSGPETRNARGADARPGLTGQTAVNREAGTRASPRVRPAPSARKRRLPGSPTHADDPGNGTRRSGARAPPSRRLRHEALGLAGVGVARHGGDRLHGHLGVAYAGAAQRGGQPGGQPRLVDAAGSDDLDVGAAAGLGHLVLDHLGDVDQHAAQHQRVDHGVAVAQQVVGAALDRHAQVAVVGGVGCRTKRSGSS
jgi:IS605 OrfB family transposase